MYETATPRVASYLVIRKEGKIAFVLRSNTKWMDGKYGLPAGKVEKGETFSAGAVREGLEEAGVRINKKSLKFLHAMHRLEQTDWVDIFFEADEYEGELYNAEPEIHSELAWLDPDALPENTVPSIRFALEKIASGELYSEFGWDS